MPSATGQTASEKGGRIMYTKILVPLDGSALAERALPHAGEIARSTGAEGILLQVGGAPLRGAAGVGGSPPDGTLGFAHRENLDLLIRSTHGRSGVSKLLMGSVAEKVMLTTKRSVMLVKPERSRTERIEEVDAFLSAH